MNVVITDVSVFFDLYSIQVLPEFFALDLEVHTTDFVYNEIVREEQKKIFELFERSKKLHIIKTTEEEEDEIKKWSFFGQTGHSLTKQFYGRQSN